ncbi:prolipoprotein diacylglyceryl transferase [Candidatus Neptunochlamydia vexilliferae]|uniref:Phosphatidylglycerol--prolipoprotein diacylglyceryl transferase n=1 Tax=Candidatus Neptunichlamydia vexilliferae TaxID=1651774 RepID=A0ABS0B0M6_9BACT|nr:prolipoprotein diacylglyceryl transferase [Candidatus Neptunochlamydia vexilliferae]MBF5059953.1 Prolipoprotein diacylglyceryl transferase [Candidatus Neptunochlamydia vexilliferae]
MDNYFFWDVDPIAFTIPLINRPIAWYGILFAIGFFLGFYLLVSLVRKAQGWDKKEAVRFSEKLTVYVIIGTVVGARLGHILFYENLREYLLHPLDILKTWEGGLASHGGVVGIFIALTVFYFRQRKVSILRTVDLIVVPALLVGTLIRLGNFVNQEVLGTVTTVPWAVVFGHPIDGSLPTPRHPAQLYEALFYFAMFLTFWKLFPRMIAQTGRLAGLFFVAVFAFRFGVEFLKEEQSHLLGEHLFTMGQWLSIPLVFLGIILLWKERRGEVDQTTFLESR